MKKQGKQFYLNEFNNFIKIMPSILSSDSHSLNTIGNFFTYIKMDTLNFEGLKQILFEPKLRTCVNEDGPPIPSYPYITSIKVTGGYYQNTNFSFSHELNTIIGGRGSGKSTIVDLIRFAFNKYESTSNDYQGFLDRIYNLLRYNNTVEVTVAHGELFTTIRRTCLITTNKSKQGTVTYTDMSDIPDYKGIDIELYTQGNLKQITKRANEQLKLIDDIGNLHRYHRRINRTQKILKLNAKEQLSKLELIKKDLYQASEVDNLKRGIADKEAQLNDEKIIAFSRIQIDKNFYDLVVNNIISAEKLVRESFEESNQKLNVMFPENRTEIMKVLEEQLNLFKENLISKQTELLNYWQSNLGLIRNIKINTSNWIDQFEQKREEYFEYLKEKKLENVADETNQLKEQKDKLLHLENNVLPKITSKIGQLKEMQIQREFYLKVYYKIVERLKQKRKETCAKITQDRQDIKILISDRQDKKTFTTYLEEQLSGLNIKLKDVPQIIAQDTSDLSVFLKMIKEQDMKGLEKQYKITTDAAGKMLSKYGSDVPVSEYGLSVITSELFDLEIITFEDVIEIEILDDNDQKYKKFSRFSPGQQCAYLLSILLDANSNPLIIDQPEDELDWNYIDTFIKKLRSCKTDIDGSGRQFVFVTHNQNITVLADSENIIKTLNIPTSDENPLPSGKIEASGGLERFEVKNAVLSLEGGAKAFTMRKFKYGLK